MICVVEITSLNDLKIYIQNYLVPKYFLGSKSMEMETCSKVYFKLRLIKVCQHRLAVLEL